MNKNPIKSNDIKFGVPNVFTKIFNDLKQQMDVNAQTMKSKKLKAPGKQDDTSFLTYFNKMQESNKFEPIYDDVVRDGGMKQSLQTKKQVQTKVSPFS